MILVSGVWCGVETPGPEVPPVSPTGVPASRPSTDHVVRVAAGPALPVDHPRLLAWLWQADGRLSGERGNIKSQINNILNIPESKF